MRLALQKTKRPAARGFTIIEILTAMAIFTMVVAAIFASWQAVAHGSVSGNRAVANAQRSRVALRTIEEALGSTRSFVADVDYYTFEADNGSEPYLSFVTRLSPQFLRSGEFRQFNVRRVTFALEQGPDNEKRLVMRQAALLQDMPEDEQNYPVVLANGVSKFEMEFWDKQKGDWLDEWTQTNQLPQMVKFSVQMDGASADDKIIRIVALPSVAVQSGWQIPGSTLGGPGFRSSGPNGIGTGGLGGSGGAVVALYSCRHHQRHHHIKARQMNIALHSSVEKQSRGGIALIVVMIAIFVLSLLAGAFAYSMKTESKLALNANNQSDLEWVGRSGAEYARWMLAQAKCPYDSLNQKWAGGPGSACETNGPLADVSSLDNIPVGDGSFSLKIKDLERKVNVNTADEATLEQVMRVIGADANESSVIVDSILDWIDRDDNTHISGAESDYYQGLTPPYTAKNAPIDDISELLLIKGIRDDPEIYSAEYANVEQVDRFGNPIPPRNYAAHLVDVFTPISTGRININTADKIGLQMIPGVDEAIADQIIRVRSGPDGADGTDDDTPFASVGELASAGLPQTAAPTLNRYCTVRSSTFEVEIDAQVGQSKQTYYAILGRNNPNDIQILSFYPK